MKGSSNQSSSRMPDSKEELIQRALQRYREKRDRQALLRKGTNLTLISNFYFSQKGI